MYRHWRTASSAAASSSGTDCTTLSPIDAPGPIENRLEDHRAFHSRLSRGRRIRGPHVEIFRRRLHELADADGRGRRGAGGGGRTTHAIVDDRAQIRRRPGKSPIGEIRHWPVQAGSDSGLICEGRADRRRLPQHRALEIGRRRRHGDDRGGGTGMATAAT